MMMRRRKRRKRAAKGKSQATCTRQQPPTSEELIINLLSPSPKCCRSNSTTFASLSPAPLSRLPPSLAPLRPPPSLSLVLPPSLLSLSLSSRAPLRFPSSLFSSPFPRPRCAGLRVYDYDYSRSRFRRFPFAVSLSISSPSYRPPNLVATFGLPNAHDAMHEASRRLKSTVSFQPTTTHGCGKKATDVICGAIISSRGVAHRCVISRDSRYRDGWLFPSQRRRGCSISVVRAEDEDRDV